MRAKILIKKFFKKILKEKNVGQEIIKFTICLIAFITLLCVYKKYSEAVFFKIFDVTIFSSIVCVFLIDSVAKGIYRYFKKRKEDATKLVEDYDKMLKQYSRVKDFIKIHNTTQNDKNIKIGRTFTNCKYTDNNGDEYRLPDCNMISLQKKKIVIKDNNEKTYLPSDYVLNRIDEFDRIYEFSKTYNNTNIRLDSISDKDGVVTLNTSRTKYYYSLMTNRSIDYRINGISYRDMFEEGPWLNDLSESTLSNHLGYNGYVKTNDNKFIFILRHKKVSIGKNTLQNSVGASLKAKFALNDNKALTTDKIAEAIKEEIIDELSLERLKNSEGKEFSELKKELFKDFSFENNVLYFYRDVVEGGKPQFMFYVDLDLSSKDILKAFKSDPKKKSKGIVKRDGYKMILVEKDKMKDIYIAPDCFVINEKPYKAMPSTIATHVMMMEYLNNGNT